MQFHGCLKFVWLELNSKGVKYHFGP